MAPLSGTLKVSYSFRDTPPERGGYIDKGYAVCCFFYLRLMAGFRFRIGQDGARRHAGGACHKQSRCQPYGYIPSESFALCLFSFVITSCRFD